MSKSKQKQCNCLSSRLFPHRQSKCLKSKLLAESPERNNNKNEKIQTIKLNNPNYETRPIESVSSVGNINDSTKEIIDSNLIENKLTETLSDLRIKDIKEDVIYINSNSIEIINKEEKLCDESKVKIDKSINNNDDEHNVKHIHNNDKVNDIKCTQENNKNLEKDLNEAKIKLDEQNKTIIKLQKQQIQQRQQLNQINNNNSIFAVAYNVDNNYYNNSFSNTSQNYSPQGTTYGITQRGTVCKNCISQGKRCWQHR